MASFKDIMDMIAKKRIPMPSKEFWSRFDRELRGRLDAIDVRKRGRNYGFAERLNDAFSALFQPQFERLLVTTALAVVIASFALTAGFRDRPGLYTVASLTNDELVDELILITTSPASENIIDF